MSKEDTSLSIKITNYLIENYDVGTTQKGIPKVDSFTFSGTSVYKRFAKKFILADRSNIDEIDERFLRMGDEEILKEIQNVINDVKEHLIDFTQESRLREVEDEIDSILNKEDYLNAVPVVDMEDPRGSAVMLDKTTWRPTLIEEKSWARIVGQKHVATLQEIGYCGRFEYNPYSLNPYREKITSIGTETIYNKYIPSNIHTARDLTKKLNPNFEKFFTRLFTSEESLKYACNWIYYSTQRKIPVYMVLVGAGGIGKNLLAEALKYLHGPTNFTKAPPSALGTKFNGHLDESTILYYDECKFSPDRDGGNIRKNRLKEWANDFVPIEKKGVDAKDKDIFCSAIISSNHDSDIHLEQLDRKFSAMELTDLRMEKRLGLDATREIWEYIQHPDFPNAWMNWLQSRIDKDFNENIEYKGKKFDDLIISSLTTWKYELLFSYVLTGQSSTYKLSALKESIPMFPTRYSKVQDFLENFTWEGVKLGKIVIVEGSKVIKVDPKFSPAINEDMDLQKDL